MEKLNNEIIQMITNLQDMQPRQRDNIEKFMDDHNGKDQYGFSFEPFDSFSTDPLGFLETAMRLQSEAHEVYRFASVYNRHSPLYYKMSSQLEKLLGQLGSICITKAVIEQREGETFSILEDLTIGWLREMAAFHFRKCYESYMESASFFRYNGTALNLSLRFAVLDKRLQATTEKIEAIKAGKAKVDLTDRSEAVKKQAAPASETTAEPETAAPLSQKGTAFPVDKAAVRAADGQSGSEPSADADPVPDHAETAAVPTEPKTISEPGRTPVFTLLSDDELEELINDTNKYIPRLSDDLICRMSDYLSSRHSEYAESPP